MILDMKFKPLLFVVALAAFSCAPKQWVITGSQTAAIPIDSMVIKPFFTRCAGRGRA